MPIDWLPGAERIVTGKGGGSYAGGPFRGVLHRTEGSTIEGAVSVYRRVDVAPHLTVDIVRRRIVQHTPFTTAARALENKAGGIETNRRSALQVEIVGFSADSQKDRDQDVQWFGREVIGPLSRAFGIQLTAPTFYGPGCGWVLASATARQRMSFATWNAFNGWCSHQHVPEQSHWDTGEFKIATALAAANPTTPDFLEALVAQLTDDEKNRFMTFVDNYNRTWNVEQTSKAPGHEGEKVWLADGLMWTEGNTSRAATASEQLVVEQRKTNDLLTKLLTAQAGKA